MDKLLKKSFLILLFSILTIMIGVLLNNYNAIKNDTTDTLEMDVIAYLHATKKFIPISVDGINQKIRNGDAFVLYIGRITCPSCRKIVPALERFSTSNRVEIYYLDSEDTNINPTVKKFRDEHGISVVPSIIKFEGKNNYRFVKFNISGNLKVIEKSLTDSLIE